MALAFLALTALGILIIVATAKAWDHWSDSTGAREGAPWGWGIFLGWVGALTAIAGIVLFLREIVILYGW